MAHTVTAASETAASTHVGAGVSASAARARRRGAIRIASSSAPAIATAPGIIRLTPLTCAAGFITPSTPEAMAMTTVASIRSWVG